MPAGSGLDEDGLVTELFYKGVVRRELNQKLRESNMGLDLRHARGRRGRFRYSMDLLCNNQNESAP
jgi:hypothetical protein